MASAADVQSQAREVLIGQRSAGAAVSEATRAIGGSTSRPRVDAQQQAAGVLLGLSREIGKSPSTRVALRTPTAPQSAQLGRLSNSQEMAQKVVLGIGGE
jgi:phage terminase small subunit